MSWPSASEYNDAMQNTGSSFADRDLRGAGVVSDRLGLPRGNSGRFASVYQMYRPSGANWAVKCFTVKPADDQQRRYAAIGAHLKAHRLKYMVDFEFVAQGVRCGREWFPVLKMEWISGKPLDQFVAENISRPEVLQKLLAEWTTLTATLRAARIAHGDLQHGNVLVTASSELRLVDYDGMYVPALAGSKSVDLGQPNYQHPQRGENDFGPHLDHFSQWVIHSSLAAVARDARLWHLLKGGDDCLLFRKKDFENPALSKAFQFMETSRPEVRTLASKFQSLLGTPVGNFPPLDGIEAVAGEIAQVLLAGPPSWMGAAREIHVAPPPPAPAPPTELERLMAAGWAQIGASVLAERPPAPQTRAADWIFDHLDREAVAPPPARAASFAPERATIVLAMAAAGAMAYAAGAGIISPIAGLLGGLVVLGLLTMYLSYRFTRRSGAGDREPVEAEFKAARAALAEQEERVSTAEAKLKSLTGQLDMLQNEIDDLPFKIGEELSILPGHEQSLRDKHERRRADLDNAEAHALATIENATRQQLAPFYQEQNSLPEREAAELKEGLKILREDTLTAALSARPIEAARVLAIGPVLIARLKESGIHTANDIEEWALENIGGIGDQRADALLEWKRHIVAATPLPALLPLAAERQIRDRMQLRRAEIAKHIAGLHENELRQQQSVLELYNHYRTNLEAESRAALQAHTTNLRNGNARFQAEKPRLEAALAAASARNTPLCQALQRQLESWRKEAAGKKFEVKGLENKLQRMTSALTLGKYLRLICGLRVSG